MFTLPDIFLQNKKGKSYIFSTSFLLLKDSQGKVELKLVTSFCFVIWLWHFLSVLFMGLLPIFNAKPSCGILCSERSPVWHSPGSCFYLQPSPYTFPWCPFVRKSKGGKQMLKGEKGEGDVHVCTCSCVFCMWPALPQSRELLGKFCAQSRHHWPLQQAFASLVCFPGLIPLFLPQGTEAHPQHRSKTN